MPNSTCQTIHLTPENVMEIAKNTLKPAGWKCEWAISSNSQNPCSVVLGSWNAYLKHLLQHSQYQQIKTGKYACYLPRCNLPMAGANTSFGHLMNHFENSHMSRASLYCPFRGCEGVAFSRGASQLENHFKETHSDLLNKVIPVPSDLMLPIAVPYFPLPREIPALPLHPMPGCLFIPAVRGTRVRHVERPPLSQASQASPRKRLKLHQHIVEEETSSEQSSIFFDDFKKQLNEKGEFIGTIGCIFGQKVGPFFDVARPQPILDPAQFGTKSPPLSIHYSVFSDRFDEMERAGMVSRANMPAVPISTQTSSTAH